MIAGVIVAVVLLGIAVFARHEFGRYVETRASLRVREQKDLHDSIAGVRESVNGLTAAMESVNSTLTSQHDVVMSVTNALTQRMHGIDCEQWDLNVRVANGSGSKRLRVP